jgi:hypothetical protein
MAACETFATRTLGGEGVLGRGVVVRFAPIMAYDGGDHLSRIKISP